MAEVQITYVEKELSFFNILFSHTQGIMFFSDTFVKHVIVLGYTTESMFIFLYLKS